MVEASAWVASIVAVGEAADRAISLGYDLYGKVRARQEATEMIAAVVAFKTVLKLLCHFVEANVNALQLPLFRLLLQPDGPLRECEKLLAEIEGAGELRSEHSGTLTEITWPWLWVEMSKKLEIIERHQNTFTLALPGDPGIRSLAIHDKVLGTYDTVNQVRTIAEEERNAETIKSPVTSEPNTDREATREKWKETTDEDDKIHCDDSLKHASLVDSSHPSPIQEIESPGNECQHSPCVLQAPLQATHASCQVGTSSTNEGEEMPVSPSFALQTPNTVPEISQMASSSINKGNEVPASILSCLPPPIHSEGLILEPKWKQYRSQSILFCVTATIVIATIAVSFLTSSHQPITIFSMPENTIFAINIGSALSVFLLGELLIGACDNLRWFLAASPTGIGMATFLALGRSTDLAGVFNLMFSNQRVGHRKWCGQRYLITHIELTIVLYRHL